MSAVADVALPLIRPLRADDLERVVEIENASYPFPWTHGIFSECVRVGYACFALQLGPELAGYSVQNWGAGEAHLLNLCVAPAWQRRGLGRLLLDHAIGHARALGCRFLFLEVRPSNHAAARLYLGRGFEAVGRRPAYYPADDGREDALVMRLGLQSGVGAA